MDGEQALFARLQAGDEEALRELFEHYSDQLLRVANAMLRDSDAASDAVQDVFVALWNGRGRYDVPDDVGRYLRRGVRNRALKAIEHDETAARARLTLCEVTTEESAAYNDGPVLLDETDRETAITAALALLQPRTAEIFRLARIGLRSGEIADLLGVSPATVYNQLSRALKFLAQELAGWNR